MELFPTFTGKCRVSPLDKPINKPRYDIHLSAFALLFSEIVQYSQNKVYTVPELQKRLSDMGYGIGQRIINVIFIRDKNFKRETKLINMLIFIKTSFWRTLFGKEADKLEHANDDQNTYYIIEAETIVNKYLSYNRDKGNLNCAAFISGMIEAVLNECNFPAKVTVHWHKGTTFMIKFDESVILRDRSLDSK